MKRNQKRRVCLYMVLMLIINIFIGPIETTAMAAKTEVSVSLLQVKQIKKLPEGKK